MAEHAKQLEAERQAQAERAREEQERRAAEAAKRQEESESQLRDTVEVSHEKQSKTFTDNKKKDLNEILAAKKQKELEQAMNRGKGSFEEKRANKMNLNAYKQYTGDEEDSDDDVGPHHHRRSLASIKRAREKQYQKFLESQKGPAEKIIHDVIIPETITVQELASRMAEKGADVVSPF